MKRLLFAAVFLTSSFLPASSYPAHSTPLPTAPRLAQKDINDDGTLTPQGVQKAAKDITVRISSENNGGSGVIIAKKGDSYLILTNAHVVRQSNSIAIQAPDGQKYQAKSIDGGFNSKYDLALLQFTSKTKYALANLKGIADSPIEPTRKIYSSGFPFDSRDLRITSGEVSQLTDIPFDDGTQIGYVTNKGEKGIRQGMSGGAIFDAQGNFLGINTIGIAPILPNYTYSDGSKPIPKLAAQYTRANWGIPVYNFLTHVKADILYGYENLPKVEHQVTLKGYMAERSQKARKMTVRIENNETGSGVIIAKSGNDRNGFTYYVLTAKHVVDGNGNSQIITYDQDRHQATSTVVAKGVDLAVVKFSSKNDYSVAQLNEYSPNNNDLVFVGGFPDRGDIKSPLWQWQLNPGTVNDSEQGKLQTQNNKSFDNGYDLVYSSISYGGMSGGPVFDTAGNVIGIHGRAESTNLSSLGISIQIFTGLFDKLHINSSLLKVVKTSPVELKPENRKNVIETMRNIPKPQSANDGERWLAYANQLYRTRQMSDAIVAFDRAIEAFVKVIDKNKVLLANYGKALSLAGTGKYQLAENAIIQAIAVAPINKKERAIYYYLWKRQAIILADAQKYDESLKAIEVAIGLNQDDPTLFTEKAYVLSRQKKYTAVIAIYDILIKKYPKLYAYIYYGRGNAKSNLGNNQGAIADYTEAIEINPNYLAAYNNRGVAKYKSGNNQSAIADFNQAIKINYKDNNAYNNRGIAKSNLGYNQEAIQDYSQAIALNPKDGDAYVNRGTAKFQLGYKQEALIDLDKAIALNPQYGAYVNRGNIKSKLGYKQEAILDFNQAINLNPRDADTYIIRGNIKSELGYQQEAILDYDRAININPKDAEAYSNRGSAKFKLGYKQEAVLDFTQAINLNPKAGSPYYNRGVAKSDLGYKQEAIFDYDRAIALNPKYAEAYVNRGNAKSSLGDQQNAILDYNQAIKIDPKLANAYSTRGVSKLYLGRTQEALIDLDKAIALNPNIAGAYKNRGGIKVFLGKNKEAIIDFDRAIILDPNDASSYSNRGGAKSILGRNPEAIIDFDRAIVLNPKNADAYYNRGKAKSALGRIQEAILDYDRAIALNLKYANAYINRGGAKSALGNKQEAILDYDRAIALNPKDAYTYNNRGNAKSELGNKQEAIKDYDRAIAVNPRYAEAYINRGVAKLDLGNKQEAICKTSIKADSQKYGCDKDTR